MNAELAEIATTFAPGRELDGGKYRLIRKLGAGGMGEVFEAENTLTRKRVAIKCLHPMRAQRAEASARLLREAEAASRIRHPHVVDVYDVGREGDSVFLVMEYLEGEPLSHMIVRGGTPIHELIALLLPAMRAVAAAHRLGVVHRDIKPDNIFLACEADNERPVAKVLDFGISKLSAHEGVHASLTRSGSTLGTPRYMAYEQLMSDKTIDGRVDVYAFGVILYEALTGHSPYEAETYPELIVKIAHGELIPPKQLRPELPSTLDRLVCWALERDRDRRVSSVDALIRELEPFSSKRLMQAEMTIADQVVPQLLAAGFSSTIRSRTAPTDLAPQTSIEAGTAQRGRATVLVGTCLGLTVVATVAGWVWLRPAVHEPEAERTSSLPPEPVVATGRAGASAAAGSPGVAGAVAMPPSPRPAAVEPKRPEIAAATSTPGATPKPRPAKPMKVRAAEQAEPPPPPALPVDPPSKAAEADRAAPPPEAATPYRVKVPHSKEF